MLLHRPADPGAARTAGRLRAQKPSPSLWAHAAPRMCSQLSRLPGAGPSPAPWPHGSCRAPPAASRAFRAEEQSRFVLLSRAGRVKSELVCHPQRARGQQEAGELGSANTGAFRLAASPWGMARVRYEQGTAAPCAAPCGHCPTGKAPRPRHCPRSDGSWLEASSPAVTSGLPRSQSPRALSFNPGPSFLPLGCSVPLVLAFGWGCCSFSQVLTQGTSFLPS